MTRPGMRQCRSIPTEPYDRPVSKYSPPANRPDRTVYAHRASAASTLSLYRKALRVHPGVRLALDCQYAPV